MDITFTIQIGLAVIFALSIGIWMNTKHAEYKPPEGIVEMIILVHFFKKNFPALCEDKCLNDSMLCNNSENNIPERVSIFKKNYDSFREREYLKEDDLIPGTDKEFNFSTEFIVFIFMALLLFLTSPFLFNLFFRESKENQYGIRYTVLIHTQERAMYTMQIVGILLSIIIFGIMASYFFDDHLQTIVILMLLIPLIFLLACLCMLVVNQYACSQSICL